MSNSKFLGVIALTFTFAANHSVQAQTATVDFEALPVGTQFGGAPLGNLPGDFVFNEDGIGVHVDNFTLGAFVGFNNVTIGGFTDPSFPTTPVTINNIRLDFDLSGLGGSVTGAAFDYADFGGDENLVINGTVLELLDFTSAPAAVGGVSILVTPPMGGGVVGQVSLAGPLTSLAIGGQELGIDNVRFQFVPEPASVTLATFAILTGVMLSRRKLRMC